MHITVVNGFFLPVPPHSGGSTEKSWFHLGREFAARGHEVTSLSRLWRQLPAEEVIAGVAHRRLPGFDHSTALKINLLKDFIWSWRVYRKLPKADIVICNAVTLPLWLGARKPEAGRVVLMAGRMPKGQYRRYRAIARILAPSRTVAERVVAENPVMADRIRVTGYPIDYARLGTALPSPTFEPASAPGTITLGFVGRIHEEKGLLLLAEALGHVARADDLPPWRLLLCGPSDISRGGSGAEFRRQLLSRLAANCGQRAHLLDPQFNDVSLAALYQGVDVFCYPSLAEQGETFGVAVAEAMAAGAVPVVSALDCFRDLVRHGDNGLVFDHRRPEAAAELGAKLVSLLRSGAERSRLSQAARLAVKRYDYPRFAEDLLADFAKLAGG